MKTANFFTILAMLVTSSATLANTSSDAPQGSAAGSANTVSITTVARALHAENNAPVQLTGNILRQVNENEFIFQDTTGEIQIDVEEDAWQGKNVNQHDTITLYGKVEKAPSQPNELKIHRIHKH